MLIVQGLNVPCMAAPQKIRIVPNKAKKAVVTPKKPTKKGPTQKSNRSPPISVPPRTRYFLSKLSKAMSSALRRRARGGRAPCAMACLWIGGGRERAPPAAHCGARSSDHRDEARAEVDQRGAVAGAAHRVALEPVVAVGREQHEMDHRREQEQEHALRHEHPARIEDEPDLVELLHDLSPQPIIVRETASRAAKPSGPANHGRHMKVSRCATSATPEK